MKVVLLKDAIKLIHVNKLDAECTRNIWEFGSDYYFKFEWSYFILKSSTGTLCHYFNKIRHLTPKYLIYDVKNLPALRPVVLAHAQFFRSNHWTAACTQQVDRSRPQTPASSELITAWVYGCGEDTQSKCSLCAPMKRVIPIDNVLGWCVRFRPLQQIE